MASNVDIAEDARFKFQIIQPVLHHVAYAYNANQLAVAKHRHVAHSMAGHQAHQVGEIIPEGRRDQAVRHDVLYLHRRNLLAVLRKRAHDITFGDNTEKTSLLVTTRAPTFFARNQSAALLMLASGAIVATSVPFLSKMLSTFMAVTPCIPAEVGCRLYSCRRQLFYSEWFNLKTTKALGLNVPLRLKQLAAVYDPELTSRNVRYRSAIGS